MVHQLGYNFLFFAWHIGLSEEARADFRIMKDLANYTKVDPNDRTATIRNFLGQIKT